MYYSKTVTSCLYLQTSKNNLQLALQGKQKFSRPRLINKIWPKNRKVFKIQIDGKELGKSVQFDIKSGHRKGKNCENMQLKIVFSIISNTRETL